MFFEELEDGPVVQVGVVVVHPLGIRAVEKDDVGGDAFAEVGLEAVDALVEERLELARVPAAGSRVREVDDAHAGLPAIPLPDVAVRTFEQEAPGAPLLEQRRALGDVRVDPDADP